MNILAVDLGLKTGWACRIGCFIESGVENFKSKVGESPGMRFMNFRVWLREMLMKIKSTRNTRCLVIYEMPHYRGRAATEMGVGMATRIQEECSSLAVDYRSIHSSQLKVFATGKGRASKDDIKKRAQEWFPDIEIIDENHADALIMLKYAIKEYVK